MIVKPMLPGSVNDPPGRLGQSYIMRNHWLAKRLDELAPGGKSRTGLARALGIPPSRISEILNGSRKVKASEVRPIATYLEWPEATVLAYAVGATPMRPARRGSKNKGISLRAASVVGAVQAGQWAEALEWPPSERYEVIVPGDPAFAGLPVTALEVRGPSMNRIYPAGTVLICVGAVYLSGYAFGTGDRVIVQRRDRTGLLEATVKEYVLDEGNHAWLWPRSDDPNFQQPWRVPDGDPEDDSEDLQITALVIGSYRPESRRPIPLVTAQH